MRMLSALIMASQAAIVGAPLPANFQSAWNSEPAVVRTEGDTLHVYGKLSNEMLEPLRAQLAAAATPVRRMQIASVGGDALAGLAAGRLVRQYDLEVLVVPPACNSACANYIFLAASRKVISPGARVAWHNSCPTAAMGDPEFMRMYLLDNFGTWFRFRQVIDGAVVDDPDRLRSAFESEIEVWVERFAEYGEQVWSAHRQFFAGTGMDERAICLGDHIDLPGEEKRTDSYAYSLSVQDMERFGICNVDAPEDYAERTAEYFADGHADRAGVIHLEDYPGFKPMHGPGYCKAAPATIAPRKPPGQPAPGS